MRQSRFTEAHIIGMIKEQEAGMPTVEVCRRHGLSPATFYKFVYTDVVSGVVHCSLSSLDCRGKSVSILLYIAKYNC